jgi:hypothetical protein
MQQQMKCSQCFEHNHLQCATPNTLENTVNHNSNDKEDRKDKKEALHRKREAKHEKKEKKRKADNEKALRWKKQQ